jgi:hypothetical protein
MNKGILNRDVTIEECYWLNEDLKEGTVIYRYLDCTYGCISSEGVAVTLKENEDPFMEVPWDAVSWVE